MKIIKSKIIQKAEGRKRGKYEITLEVTDYDIEMFEDLAMTYAPFEVVEEPDRKNNFNGIYSANFNDKYLKWIHKVWHCFWKLWKLYDFDLTKKKNKGGKNE